MDFLFVYGTLLRPSAHEITSILQANSLFCDSGTFPGELFEVDGYPGAIRQPDSDCLVHGIVLTLKNPEVIFQVLDKYEEVGNEFPEPNEYTRSRIPVLCSSGETRVCWVYLYNRPTENLRQILSGKYAE